MAATPPRRTVAMSSLLVVMMMMMMMSRVEGLWCVARSEASDQVLQTALDYACSAGADCAPLQPSGLCFLPNTLQAHASYAFNSYYQRKQNAPGSCSFAGTATLAKTDPSYGSCVYPPSPSTAGGTLTTGGTLGGGTNNPTIIPILTTPPPPFTTTAPLYGNGGLTPGLGNDGPSSKAFLDLRVAKPLFLASWMVLLSFL